MFANMRIFTADCSEARNRMRTERKLNPNDNYLISGYANNLVIIHRVSSLASDLKKKEDHFGSRRSDSDIEWRRVENNFFLLFFIIIQNGAKSFNCLP